MNILIAAGEAAVRGQIRRLCERLGHRVTVARDGSEAWAAFQARPDSVVISDWRMTVKGLHLCRKIRWTPLERQPIVFLVSSVNSPISQLREAFDAGVDDILFTPLDAAAFQDQLDRAEVPA